MRRMVLVLAIAVIICIPIVGHTQDMDTAGSVITVEAELATGIQDREPVGVASTFPADVDTVYLWTRVMGAKDTTFIKCVWTYGDEEMASVELPVRSPSWRTWSSKAIMPQWTGKWDVKVLDADGNVLKGMTFTIEPASEMTSSETMGKMKEKASGAMESAKDTASKAMGSMKEKGSAKAESMKEEGSAKAESMKSEASQKAASMKSEASQKKETMKEQATEKTQTMKDTTSKKMESMKDEAMMKKDSVMKDTTKMKEPEGH